MVIWMCINTIKRSVCDQWSVLFLGGTVVVFFLIFRAMVAICGSTFGQYETGVLKGLYVFPKHKVLGY